LFVYILTYNLPNVGLKIAKKIETLFRQHSDVVANIESGAINKINCDKQ